MQEPNKNTLWTRDFTIITVGSVVSMLGSTLSGFALSLLVLDYTGSTFLYALYNILYLLPSVLAPLISGPFLDRFSRKKTIYTLDFITAGLYAVMVVLMKLDLFSFPILAVGTFLMGAIWGIYGVAYDSFYPLLITEGNYQKAYSVASTLEQLTLFVTPFSALIYNTVGIVPLFIANTATYLVAAIMETQIKAEEKYIETQEKAHEDDTRRGLKRFTADFMEGMRYLVGEKGLLAVAVYFTVSSLTGGGTGVITLPYFKSTFENGEYIYMLVWGMSAVGRIIGGAAHYRLQLNENRKYEIAYFVYVALAVLEGTYLFTPVPVMMAMCFITGLFGVTSYNIRISATQKYVPDEKKGRFNGTFNMLNTAGALVGELLAGLLTLAISERAVVAVFGGMCLIAAIVFIGGNKQEISKIYNTQA